MQDILLKCLFVSSKYSREITHTEEPEFTCPIRVPALFMTDTLL